MNLDDLNYSKLDILEKEDNAPAIKNQDIERIRAKVSNQPKKDFFDVKTCSFALSLLIVLSTIGSITLLILVGLGILFLKRALF